MTPFSLISLHISGGRVSVAVVVRVTVLVTGSGAQSAIRTTPFNIIATKQVYSTRVIAYNLNTSFSQLLYADYSILFPLYQYLYAIFHLFINCMK